MTIEEKARSIVELGGYPALEHELAWELVKLTKKIRELDLFMADHDVPYIHRKEIKDFLCSSD